MIMDTNVRLVTPTDVQRAHRTIGSFRGRIVVVSIGGLLLGGLHGYLS